MKCLLKLKNKSLKLTYNDTPGTENPVITFNSPIKAINNKNLLNKSIIF